MVVGMLAAFALLEWGVANSSFLAMLAAFLLNPVELRAYYTFLFRIPRIARKQKARRQRMTSP
jgi:hypothetical protein